MVTKTADKQKIIFSSVKEIIDTQTGEIITTEKNTNAIVEKEPPHVKIYLEDIVRLNSLPPAASKVLNLLIQNMGYNNMVPMLKPFKQIICNTLDIKMNTLEKVIAELRDKKILHVYARGLYILDPYLFAKGKWENIKNLRMTIDYDENGNRKITSDFAEKVRQLSIKFD